jgi:hypothetical protein
MTTEALAILRLCTPAEYQSDRRQVFPSTASLQWFMRRHRRKLAEARAILKPAGRLMVDALVFDRFVLMAGQIVPDQDL